MKKIRFLIILASMILNINIFGAKLIYTDKKSKVSDYEVKENETQEAEFDFSTVEPLDLQAVVKAKMDTYNRQIIIEKATK